MSAERKLQDRLEDAAKRFGAERFGADPHLLRLAAAVNEAHAAVEALFAEREAALRRYVVRIAELEAELTALRATATGAAADIRGTAAKLVTRAGSRDDDDARFMVRMALACDRHAADLGYYDDAPSSEPDAARAQGDERPTERAFRAGFDAGVKYPHRAWDVDNSWREYIDAARAAAKGGEDAG